MQKPKIPLRLPGRSGLSRRSVAVMSGEEGEESEETRGTRPWTQLSPYSKKILHCSFILEVLLGENTPHNS